MSLVVVDAAAAVDQARATAGAEVERVQNAAAAYAESLRQGAQGVLKQPFFKV